MCTLYLVTTNGDSAVTRWQELKRYSYILFQLRDSVCLPALGKSSNPPFAKIETHFRHYLIIILIQYWSSSPYLLMCLSVSMSRSIVAYAILISFIHDFGVLLECNVPVFTPLSFNVCWCPATFHLLTYSCTFRFEFDHHVKDRTWRQACFQRAQSWRVLCKRSIVGCLTRSRRLEEFNGFIESGGTKLH